MVLTRFFSNNVQSIAASSRSATTKAQQEASQALPRPGAAPEPSLAAVWEVTGFRNIADGEARHLNFSQSRRKSRAQPWQAAIAGRRLAPAANRTAAAAAITSASTKKTTIQTKLSIMTIGLRSTSQFGSQADR